MRAAGDRDLDQIGAIDQRLHAAKLVKEQRQASVRLGRQLLALAGDVFSDEISAAYLRRVRDAGLPGHQAVASGLLKAALNIPPREAVLAELYSFAASCAGAALRMAVVDHRQVQRTLLLLQPAIEAVADEALRRELWEIGGSAPFAEIMAMQHEVAEMRLFVT
jgi:urease accessory protein